MSNERRLLALLFALSVTTSGALAGSETSGGSLTEVSVHGISLEDNLLGGSPDRSVLVYLPPSYETEADRRYPVLYLLHGITDVNTVWTVAWEEDAGQYATIQSLMDRGVEQGKVEEMIVVMPDARTTFFGSLYTNSPVKGRWTDYIADDLVDYVDRNYRTIATAEARGIAGHSMGGHGALKIGMLRPDVFSVVYGMNPALLGWGSDVTASNPALANLMSVRTLEDAMQENFYVVTVIGVAQAFSPNADAPPLYADYPYKEVDGVLSDHGPGWDRWEAQMPAFMVGDYVANLKQLRGIRFDSAFVDEFAHIPAASKQFSDALTRVNIAHTFEMYNGDHRNRLWGRRGRIFAELLPYFFELLRNNRPKLVVLSSVPPHFCADGVFHRLPVVARRRSSDQVAATTALPPTADIPTGTSAFASFSSASRR